MTAFQFLSGAPVARRLELAEAASAVLYAETQAKVDPGQGAATFAVGDGDSGGAAVYTGPGSPISRAIGLGMTGPVTGADLDMIEDFLASRGAAVRVDLCPLADRTLLELLAARGYVVASFMNLFALPLRAWTPVTGAGAAGGGRAAAQAVAPLSVRPARPDEEELWVRTISEGFAGKPVTAPADTAIARPSFHKPHSIPLLAWLDGQPAGGGLADVGDGLVMLRSQSTRAGCRGRGVQSAVLRESLRLAVEAGCDLAVVQTTPGTASQRNVERAGFHLAYTKPTLVLRRRGASSQWPSAG